MDAQQIAALAALLTAAAGVAKIVAGERGKPWVIGVTIVAVVGGGLLATSLIPGSKADATSRAKTETRDYQNHIRAICEDDAEAETNYKQAMEGIVGRVQSGDQAAFGQFLLVAADALDKERARSGDLEALDPPGHLEKAHNEAVGTWKKKIAGDQSFYEGVRAAFPQGPEVMIAHLDGPESREAARASTRLQNRVDGYLRTLAGSGCLPAP